MARQKWIGVDLDGTLAHFDHWRGFHHIGDPIDITVHLLKWHVEHGYWCKIFTGRWTGRRTDTGEHLNHSEIKRIIDEWMLMHLGFTLEITNVKDMDCMEIWDDGAYAFERNTGRCVGRSSHHARGEDSIVHEQGVSDYPLHGYDLWFHYRTVQREGTI